MWQWMNLRVKVLRDLCIPAAIRVPHVADCSCITTLYFTQMTGHLTGICNVNVCCNVDLWKASPGFKVQLTLTCSLIRTQRLKGRWRHPAEGFPEHVDYLALNYSYLYRPCEVWWVSMKQDIQDSNIRLAVHCRDEINIYGQGWTGECRMQRIFLLQCADLLLF